MLLAWAPTLTGTFPVHLMQLKCAKSSALLISRENYALADKGPRVPAISSADGVVANPADKPDGFSVRKSPFDLILRDVLLIMRPIAGTLPVDESQGVHSLQDVSVFANGPGSEAFRGVCKYLVYSSLCQSLMFLSSSIDSSVDIFFKIADALALGKEK